MQPQGTIKRTNMRIETTARIRVKTRGRNISLMI